MNRSLKDKVQAFLDPKNHDPVARIFRDPSYTQDEESRRIQILFLKLLMVTANADQDIDESEVDLIRSYAMERCLSEKEWREIDYFRLITPSAEEVHSVISSVVNELRNFSQKRQLESAIRELIQSDGIIAEKEEEILSSLKRQLESADISILGNAFRGISKLLGRANQDPQGLERESIEFANNPIAPILNRVMDEADVHQVSTLGAKLGLMVLLANVDGEFHPKEKAEIEKYLVSITGLEKEKTKETLEIISKIKTEYFEVSKLCRILVDSLSMEDRSEFVSVLFSLVRADKHFDLYEDRYIHLIARSLFVSRAEFNRLKAKK